VIHILMSLFGKQSTMYMIFLKKTTNISSCTNTK